mmetsp:Transcript_15317/g.20195  ORF Transcript_15317/g.20195 Transcript_15317/m.20195 type:complete len:526 (+) Transcript_15317:225-1802(+)
MNGTATSNKEDNENVMQINVDEALLENDSSSTLDDKEVSFEIIKESKLLFSIALPTVATQFSTFIIYPLTASSVGRNLGTEELASFSLASLTGNLVCLSIIMGVMTAADTLMPRAFGAKRYAEIGRLAIRVFVVCALILVLPYILLLGFIDKIFVTLGQDEFISSMASVWLRFYCLGVPFTILFRLIQRFLAAQHIVLPTLYSSALGSFLIHPLLLRYLIPSLGFVGSGLVIVITQCVQAFLLLFYLRVSPIHHPLSWPGLSWSYFLESIQLEPMMQFLKLSLGGVLSLTEWWFWECVCFMAGHLGVIPLCIHTIAYNVIPIFFMIPLGLNIGLSVRMGNLLATNDVHGAKYLAKLIMFVTIVVASILTLLLFYLRDQVIALFTSDEQVQKGCWEIWSHLCIYMVSLAIFCINGGIMRSLGLQWKMAGIVVLCLWCMCLPVLLVAVRNGGNITTIWTILPCFYIFMNVLLIGVYTTTDWQAVSDSVRSRTELEMEGNPSGVGFGSSEKSNLINRQKQEVKYSHNA